MHGRRLIGIKRLKGGLPKDEDLLSELQPQKPGSKLLLIGCAMSALMCSSWLQGDQCMPQLLSAAVCQHSQARRGCKRICARSCDSS